MIKVYRPITIYFSCQSSGGAANLIRDRQQDQDNKTLHRTNSFYISAHCFFKEILGSTCISNSLEVHPYH